MVISTSCSRASRSTKSSSKGLAKRASATVVDSPRAASSSAAFKASPSRVPSDRMAIRSPSRTIRPLPIASGTPSVGHLDADALAARIAEGDRTLVVGRRGRDHVHELRLVGRRHHHEVRQAAEIGEVERAGVGRPVGADEAGAIDGEAHRQLLDRDVMHDLVVGALQEGRIDRAERLKAFGRQAGRERDGMLLGDADVERALRELFRRTCRRPCRTASRP